MAYTDGHAQVAEILWPDAEHIGAAESVPYRQVGTPAESAWWTAYRSLRAATLDASAATETLLDGTGCL